MQITTCITVKFGFSKSLMINMAAFIRSKFKNLLDQLFNSSVI